MEILHPCIIMYVPFRMYIANDMNFRNGLFTVLINYLNDFIYRVLPCSIFILISPIRTKLTVINTEICWSNMEVTVKEYSFTTFYLLTVTCH